MKKKSDNYITKITGSFMKKNGKIIFLLYFLAFIFLGWSIFTFAYQYLAALGHFSDVLKAFEEKRLLSALYLSLTSSFATVILGVIFGIPVAYLFAMKEFKGKTVIETLSVEVPQTFPPIAEGMIYLLMLGPTSFFHVNLAFTFTALVIAKIYVSVPFIISFGSAKFREIKNTGMDLTARSLGASSFQVFRMIFLPLALKNILAGTTLCWSRAMGELGGSLIFAGVIAYKTEIIPTLIAKEAQTMTIAALAATILVTTASTLALVTFKTITKK
ncbi:MAG: ABC transporter permease [Chlamydiae bacterium]|nr:ABC transporter permease [Chlamydiota bacterium]